MSRPRPTDARKALDPESVALAPKPSPVTRATSRTGRSRFHATKVVGRIGAYGVPEVAPDFTPRWLGVARLTRDVQETAEDDVKEPAATAVVGHVQREDGSPVEGAEVILYSSFYLRQAYYDHRVREIGRVYTDEQGAFDMRPIDMDTVHFGSNGEVLVTVRHPRLPDLVAQRLDGLVPGAVSDVGTLVLPEAPAVVSGTIRDLQGKPVAGAVVRASGLMNPVDYDKVERMVVLSACPSARTDEEGRYRLGDFAPGRHQISVHVNIDCVIHVDGNWRGEREWSPRVLAGHGVRGRVVGADGEPVAHAVVRGGGNWTPSGADGTFWLDNVRAGPLTLQVFHDAWARQVFPGVETDAEDPVELTLTTPLPRVTLEVTDASGQPVPIVDLTWHWRPGKGPNEFTPDSPHWHDPGGRFEVIVPEGANGIHVERKELGGAEVPAEDLQDGRRLGVVLQAPDAKK